jgi:hypothetical protein
MRTRNFVFIPSNFQQAIKPLCAHNGFFLRQETVLIGIGNAQFLIATAHMLNEIWIQLYLPFLLCLVFDYSHYATFKQLIPPQCSEVTDTEASKDASGDKETHYIVLVFEETMNQINGRIEWDIIGCCFRISETHINFKFVIFDCY